MISSIMTIILGLLLIFAGIKIGNLQVVNRDLKEQIIYMQHFYENKAAKIVNTQKLKGKKVHWICFPFTPVQNIKMTRIEWVNPETKEVEGYEVPIKEQK